MAKTALIFWGGWEGHTPARSAGIVKDILTNSATHPHGIKVRLTDGQVGRVQHIEE